MSNIKNVTVLGTGVIGAGWIIRCLAHNKKVTAFDKDLKLEKRLVAEIKRTWPYVKKLFNKKKLNLNKLKFVDSIKEAVQDVDFIQECVSENYSLKIKLTWHGIILLDLKFCLPIPVKTRSFIINIIT